MKNPLRTINEKGKKMSNIEILYSFLAIMGIPQILNLFIPLNLQFIGMIYIIMSILLFVEGYFYKNRNKIK